LDVGSGTGVLSFALLGAARPARVTGVDVSEDYVAYASGKRSDPRVEFEVGDAQKLRFADASFDKSLSLLVVNFIPDPARAAKEMMRVTRPGGVVTAAVWDYGDGMQMLRVFFDEAIAFDSSVEPRDESHMPLCRQGELGAFFRQQGFENVQEAPLTAVLRFESFDDYWAPFLLGQGPAGAYVASLPKDRQAALASRLRHRLLGDGPDHPFELQVRAWAVKGTVPRK
jgi:ubiquinone/menaquinone biosynthesis C-methylase UbiE